MINSIGTSSTNTISKDAKSELSLEGLKWMDASQENIKRLSEYSDEDLQKIKNEAVEAEDYDIAKLIKSTLDWKKQIALDAENKKKQNAIDTNKKEAKSENEAEVARLKELLWDSDKFAIGNKITYDGKEGEIVDWEVAEWEVRVKYKWWNTMPIKKETLENNDTFKVIEQKNKINPELKELIEGLIASQEKNREENSSLLEELKDAKRKWSTERIQNLKNLIKNAQAKTKELQDKYKVETVKYPKDEIATMNTKRIKWRWISRKTIKTADGKETTIKRPSLKRNKNIRSRRKLNKVVKAFNGFKTDSDSAVKYILTQERWGRIDALTWADSLAQSMNKGRYNLLHKTWFVMSKDKFSDKFDKQKKVIIDNFSKNINPDADSKEGKTIKALEDRMKYYKQEYLNKHY